MELRNIVSEIELLSPDAQKQVMDFVSFLKKGSITTPDFEKIKPVNLIDEPFIGMWQDREDMQDSTAWLQKLRRGEWGHAL